MKATYVSIIVAAIFIGGAFVLAKNGSVGNNIGQDSNANNVTVVDGQQIVEIRAKGGYSPRKSVAKAGIPTVLRFDTSGTFDCSSSVRVPSMNISKLLPQNGSTDIDIGAQKVAILKGTCGMGMYPFEVEFRG